MKTSALVVIAAFMMSATVPVFAAQTAAEKETCLIAAGNCADRAKTIQKEVMKMKKEIKAGKTYSQEDLKALEQKLQDALDQIEMMKGKKK